MGIYFSTHTVPRTWFRFQLRESIELIKAFIESVDKQIDLGLEDFENNQEVQEIKERTEYGTEIRVINFYHGLNSETWDLDSIFTEHLPNLQRRSALITLFGFLEDELNKLCFIYKETENFSVQLKDMTGKGIDKSILYLEKVAGLPIKKDAIWKNLTDIQKIRNIIVHHDGRLYNIEGVLQVVEAKIVQSNPLLSGDRDIIILKGYLQFVLKCFGEIFTHIDELIQKAYEGKDKKESRPF